MNVIKIINNFFRNIINTEPKIENNDSFISISNEPLKYFPNSKNNKVNTKSQQQSNNSFINIDSNFKNTQIEQTTDYSNCDSTSFIILDKDNTIQKNIKDKGNWIFSNSISNTSFKELSFDKSFNITSPIRNNVQNTIQIQPLPTQSEINIKTLKNEPIIKKENMTQEEAATKINTHAKKLLTKIRLKKANKYGFKKLKYTRKDNLNNTTPFTQEFLISKNGYTFIKPQIESYIENGDKGTFKKIIAKDNHSILFTILQSSSFQNTLNSHEIEEILDKYGIKNYRVTHKIADKIAIARNAGQKDLKSYCNNNQFFTINDFKNILSDTKQLHKNGYFHLDLKPQNIQVKEKNINGLITKTLSVIDLDSLSHFTNTPNIAGTPYFTTYALMKLCFPKTNHLDITANPPKEALQVFDEFALAISIMESVGVTLERRKEYWPIIRIFGLGNIEITKEIKKFINENIKEEFKDIFKLLINDPIKYIETLTQNNKAPVYLSDMLNFK